MTHPWYMQPVRIRRSGHDFMRTVAHIKAIPGAKYLPERKQWLMPVETLDLLGDEIEAGPRPAPPPHNDYNEGTLAGLRAYQADAARDVSHTLIAFEPGLGKTATALWAARLPALVICPAMVRESWETEAKRWRGINAKVMLTGKDAATVLNTSFPEVTVCSYELGPKLPALNLWRTIILDEAHMIKSATTKRAAWLREFTKAVAPTLRLALTGTPIGNGEALDFFRLLDWLYPGRFGSEWAYKSAYCQTEPEPYARSGLRFFGVNPRRADELKSRIAACAHIVTKSEVASDLPPFIPTTLNVRNKMQAIEQWHDDTPAPRAIVCYFRETAAQIGNLLTGVDGAVITGALPLKKRLAAIDACASRGGTVIATMDSIGVGINNLAQFSNVLFVEYADDPLTVEQAAMRFHRLTTRAPVTVTFLCSDDEDQQKVLRLRRKLDAAKRVIKQTLADTKLALGLGSGELTQDALVKRMMEVLK